ncbi:hypothetical protein BGX26_009615, partial [Mortierella sp. AD094]
ESGINGPDADGLHPSESESDVEEATDEIDSKEADANEDNVDWVDSGDESGIGDPDADERDPFESDVEEMADEIHDEGADANEDNIDWVDSDEVYADEVEGDEVVAS